MSTNTATINDPFIKFGEAILSEESQIFNLKQSIVHNYHNLGDLLFSKQQELKKTYRKKSELQHAIQNFLQQKYPADRYSENFRKEALKFLKFADKTAKWNKSLKERAIQITTSWNEAAIAALLEIKQELIPEALNQFADRSPKGSEIRKWKQENSSLVAGQKFTNKDKVTTAKRFNLKPEHLDEIVAIAKKRRINSLTLEGADLDSADPTPLTDDVIAILADRNYNTGKFLRTPRSKTKHFTEKQVQQKIQAAIEPLIEENTQIRQKAAAQAQINQNLQAQIDRLNSLIPQSA